MEVDLSERLEPRSGEDWDEDWDEDGEDGEDMPDDFEGGRSFRYVAVAE